MTRGVIVGSAFTEIERELEVIDVLTDFGPALVHRDVETDGLFLFRHGLPHTLLPNQINYRANIAALASLGCDALMVTSSVGVMNRAMPLFEPIAVDDLLMLDNRLPDGTACTMFVEPSESQGHLLIQEGLFNQRLNTFLRDDDDVHDATPTFAYVQGPRTKTAAENRLLATLGGDVNSMTLGPEIVLANELEIPTCALVVGHKYSSPGVETPNDVGIAESLDRSKAAMMRLVVRFLRDAPAVAFANAIYRFGD